MMVSRAIFGRATPLLGVAHQQLSDRAEAALGLLTQPPVEIAGVLTSGTTPQTTFRLRSLAFPGDSRYARVCESTRSVRSLTCAAVLSRACTGGNQREGLAYTVSLAARCKGAWPACTQLRKSDHPESFAALQNITRSPTSDRARR